MTVLSDLIEQARPRFRTATEFVSETLRTAILNGTFDDGTALRQDELAANFGVSRMPVREALRQLEAEGLVDFQPHKGAVVAPLPLPEISEVFEMRLMAEAFALRLSLPHLTEEALDHAESLLDALDGERDFARWSQLNREFHATLHSGAPRKRLAMLIGQLHGSVDRYMRLLLFDTGYDEGSQQEHRAILTACRAGDVDGAVDGMRRHLTGGGQILVEALRRHDAAKQRPGRA